jgi:hypothetical protein
MAPQSQRRHADRLTPHPRTQPNRRRSPICREHAACVVVGCFETRTAELKSLASSCRHSTVQPLTNTWRRSG